MSLICYLVAPSHVTLSVHSITANTSSKCSCLTAHHHLHYLHGHPAICANPVRSNRLGLLSCSKNTWIAPQHTLSKAFFSNHLQGLQQQLLSDVASSRPYPPTIFIETHCSHDSSSGISSSGDEESNKNIEPQNNQEKSDHNQDKNQDQVQQEKAQPPKPKLNLSALRARIEELRKKDKLDDQIKKSSSRPGASPSPFNTPFGQPFFVPPPASSSPFTSIVPGQSQGQNPPPFFAAAVPGPSNVESVLANSDMLYVVEIPTRDPNPSSAVPSLFQPAFEFYTLPVQNQKVVLAFQSEKEANLFFDAVIKKQNFGSRAMVRKIQVSQLTQYLKLNNQRLGLVPKGGLTDSQAPPGTSPFGLPGTSMPLPLSGSFPVSGKISTGTSTGTDTNSSAPPSSSAQQKDPQTLEMIQKLERLFKSSPDVADVPELPPTQTPSHPEVIDSQGNLNQNEDNNSNDKDQDGKNSSTKL